MKTDFHYRSLVGQIVYLLALTWPEIMVAVHQCAHFSVDPRLQHEQAIKLIVCYLKQIPDYLDDATAWYSRTDFIIWLAGCPLIWSLKLQLLLHSQLQKPNMLPSLSCCVMSSTMDGVQRGVKVVFSSFWHFRTFVYSKDAAFRDLKPFEITKLEPHLLIYVLTRVSRGEI
jgi:hypothetical protein